MPSKGFGHRPFPIVYILLYPDLFAIFDVNASTLVFQVVDSTGPHSAAFFGRLLLLSSGVRQTLAGLAREGIPFFRLRDQRSTADLGSVPRLGCEGSRDLR